MPHHQLRSVEELGKLGLSEAELREGLRAHLRSRGHLERLQAQLRERVVGELALVGKPKAPQVAGLSRLRWSLVAEALRCAGLQHTLAVFVPESGLGTLGAALSHAEASEAAGVRAPDVGRCLLDVVLEKNSAPRRDGATQTEAAVTTQDTRQSLGDRLRSIRAAREARPRDQPNAADGVVASLEARYARRLEAEVSRIRETELAQQRRTLEAAHRAALDAAVAEAKANATRAEKIARDRERAREAKWAEDLRLAREAGRLERLDFANQLRTLADREASNAKVFDHERRALDLRAASLEHREAALSDNVATKRIATLEARLADAVATLAAARHNDENRPPNTWRRRAEDDGCLAKPPPTPTATADVEPRPVAEPDETSSSEEEEEEVEAPVRRRRRRLRRHRVLMQRRPLEDDLRRDLDAERAENDALRHEALGLRNLLAQARASLDALAALPASAFSKPDMTKSDDPAAAGSAGFCAGVAPDQNLVVAARRAAGLGGRRRRRRDPTSSSDSELDRLRRENRKLEARVRERLDLDERLRQLDRLDARGPPANLPNNGWWWQADRHTPQRDDRPRGLLNDRWAPMPPREEPPPCGRRQVEREGDPPGRRQFFDESAHVPVPSVEPRTYWQAIDAPRDDFGPSVPREEPTRRGDHLGSHEDPHTRQQRVDSPGPQQVRPLVAREEPPSRQVEQPQLVPTLREDLHSREQIDSQEPREDASQVPKNEPIRQADQPRILPTPCEDPKQQVESPQEPQEAVAPQVTREEPSRQIDRPLVMPALQEVEPPREPCEVVAPRLTREDPNHKVDQPREQQHTIEPARREDPRTRQQVDPQEPRQQQHVAAQQREDPAQQGGADELLLARQRIDHPVNRHDVVEHLPRDEPPIHGQPRVAPPSPDKPPDSQHGDQPRAEPPSTPEPAGRRVERRDPAHDPASKQAEPQSVVDDLHQPDEALNTGIKSDRRANVGEIHIDVVPQGTAEVLETPRAQANEIDEDQRLLEVCAPLTNSTTTQAEDRAREEAEALAAAEHSAARGRRQARIDGAKAKFDARQLESFATAFVSAADHDDKLNASALCAALNKLSGTKPRHDEASEMLTKFNDETAVPGEQKDGITGLDEFVALLAGLDPGIYRPPPENDAEAIFQRALQQAKLRREKDAARRAVASPSSRRPLTAPASVADRKIETEDSVGNLASNLPVLGVGVLQKEEDDDDDDDGGSDGWSFG